MYNNLVRKQKKIWLDYMIASLLVLYGLYDIVVHLKGNGLWLSENH